MENKSIVLLVDYFGHWPKYFHLFLRTCENNPSITWIIHSDCPTPKYIPNNVKIISISFLQYCKKVSETLSIDFNITNPYKLCDIRPALGVIHYNLISEYDYFGYTDLDVFYGNIRKFLPNEDWDIISSRKDWFSGHFTILKNTNTLRNAFRLMDKWREWFCYPGNLTVDEIIFPNVFLRTKLHDLPEDAFFGTFGVYNVITKNDILSIKTIAGIKCLLKEQYVTPFGQDIWFDGSTGDKHPDTFFWTNGKITDNSNHEYMYLHVMNFEKKRYVWRIFCHETLSFKLSYEDKLSWSENPNLIICDNIQNNQFRIDWSGIHTV